MFSKPRGLDIDDPLLLEVTGLYENNPTSYARVCHMSNSP